VESEWERIKRFNEIGLAYLGMVFKGVEVEEESSSVLSIEIAGLSPSEEL
jgi:hypothetical protein